MAIPKKVLILCGDYMEDTEVMVQFQALQAYGVSVDAVCPGKKSGEFCRTSIQFFAGHHVDLALPTYAELRGHNFHLNATFDEIETREYDGLIIQGGRAPEYLAMDKSVLDFVNQFSSSGKPITAMCHGQIVLAAVRLLKNRKCTAYSAVKPLIVAAGGHWVEPVDLATINVDGNLITGVSYIGNPEYISLFVKALGGTVTCVGK